MSSERTDLHHRTRRMIGRDPDEPHRASTPLELLFDLTLVVAFSQAGDQLARLLEHGHTGAGIVAFCYSLFAVCWAWINYSWLASAFDNDDVVFRIATMVQMIGVLVMALGLPALFASIDNGQHVDNAVVVAGYVVMRLSTIGLWLRAARHSPAHRRCATTYAGLISVAQVGWIALIVVNPPLAPTFAFTVALMLFEVGIPPVAERHDGGTPWHPHHIAERYSLLVIITLGEVILGTILAISAVVEEQGWSVEAGLVAFGGVALAFGLWWVYFTMPSGEVLARHRERGFLWGYGHVLLFGSLAATGAGLHVAAAVIEQESPISATAALLTVVIPVAAFTLLLFALYSALLAQVDPFHLLLLAVALLALAVAVIVVAAGASTGTGIAICACAPLAVVIGYETVGHRHQQAAVRRAVA